ncbi:hypothetical protein HPP92_021401 [Vanilla planifolia]|uniref:Uncharacterized protein n=1 Tax=Vanilla planifolia TaxID=51239 RepID=A0A835PWI9_VANPL|nr:hypothetical protein HPP92_021401 [Vanilla planifolia]
MIVGGSGGARVAGRQQQVHPVDYVAEVSQKLVDAAHRGDLAAAVDCLCNPVVDVNFTGAVRFKGRLAELVTREEAPSHVRFDCEEFITDVSPLFLAAHTGNLPLLRKLLGLGADANQKLFRGYAMTAAAREGREEAVELLLRAGAGQEACEEAVVEASRHGLARIVELIVGSDFVRPRVSVHALVTAASRGFVDVVDTLLKLGVNANGADRMLLQSLKPSLHASADCTALIAAIVSRQIAVVRQLLEARVRMDVMVRLGAWSWDAATGEELRVGAGLAEPYDAAWCAVEYFESSGAILRLLLRQRCSTPNSLHLGRSLLHHAILCSSPAAVDTLLASGADPELPVRTTLKHEFRPIHMAARLGHPEILRSLVACGCDFDSRTDAGETAIMLASRYKHGGCLKVLALSGADFGLLNSAGVSATLIADACRWSQGFRDAVLDAVKSGAVIRSTDTSVFSPLTFVAKSGDLRAMEALLSRPEFVNVDEQDENGFSAAMLAAREGHAEVFRLLVFAGANMKLLSKSGETAASLYKSSKKSDLFEQVMLDYALEKGGLEGGYYDALHCASRRGDLAAVRRLLSSRDLDVNTTDADGYTPLMLAARAGNGALCELLISRGARCDLRTKRGETALSLARASGGVKNRAEEVIKDQLARRLVMEGRSVRKHTKQGKGKPHGKTLRMSEPAGLLRWGRSRRRTVVCKVAEVGGSAKFQRNRRRKGDGFERGLFRVVTSKGREVHFVCDGGDEEAELWVRGILLVTGDVFGAVN